MEQPSSPPQIGLTEVIRQLLRGKEVMHGLEFRFDINKEANIFNFSLLRNDIFDFERLLNPKKNLLSIMNQNSNW